MTATVIIDTVGTVETTTAMSHAAARAATRAIVTVTAATPATVGIPVWEPAPVPPRA